MAKEERELLLKLGTAIGPGASKLITVVHRRTYQRWVREKNLGLGRSQESARVADPLNLAKRSSVSRTSAACSNGTSDARHDVAVNLLCW